MPRYSYTAKSLKGDEKSETIEAKDLHQLVQLLHQEGLVLVKAEVVGAPKKKGKGFSLPFFSRVSLAEKMFFARNLQVMISAGLPLPRAFQTLISQAKSKKFAVALTKIQEEIGKGQSFSESLSKYPDIFSDLFQNMIKVGEEGGSLEQSLKTLALQMEREHNLKSKIQGAMIYPAVVITAMMGVGVIMLIMVVPQLAATFKDLNAELPLTTKMVIGLAEFITKRWYFAIISFFLLIFASWRAVKTDLGKRLLDLFFLKAPIISSIVRNANSAFAVRTLSSLISAGVSLPKSLEITSNTVGNIYFKKAISQAVEKVGKGEKLSEALRPYENVIPSTVIQMISVGEETGETSNILAKLADFYEEETENKTKNLVSAIEPILMLVIGAVVGFFAISMVQPMYSMLGEIE